MISDKRRIQGLSEKRIKQLAEERDGTMSRMPRMSRSKRFDTEKRRAPAMFELLEYSSKKDFNMK